MKRKLLMALLAGTLAIAAPVSCFAAETTEAAEADAAEDSSDEEEDAEEEDAESADSDDAKEEKTTTKKKEDLKTVGEKAEGCIAFKLRNGREYIFPKKTVKQRQRKKLLRILLQIMICSLPLKTEQQQMFTVLYLRILVPLLFARRMELFMVLIN